MTVQAGTAEAETAQAGTAEAGTAQAETAHAVPVTTGTPDVMPTLTEDFKAAFGGHPAGVAIITADSVTGPVGITASSVASVSAEPPLLAFSLAASSGSAAAIAVADSVVVHLLTTDDLELAKTFANSTSERFTAVMPWTRLETGEPLLVHGGYALRCKVLSRTPAGGSLLLAAQVLQIMPQEKAGAEHGGTGQAGRSPAGTARAGAPMVYHNRNFHALGEHSVLSR